MENFHHEEGHEDGDMNMTAIADIVCKMDMSLHWGACEFILLRSWQANSTGKFIAAFIGFFLMAFIYEGLKYYREVLFIRCQESRRTVRKNSEGESIVSTVKLTIAEQMFNVPHIVQSLLHFVQVFVSYILMLIVMLCNMWLIIAICLGAALGYFAFGWLRKINYRDTSECCY